jgi:sugar-specific transcriptional regulator TrmB
MVVNIENLLMENGFSDYESRAYIGLLKRHPLTAYECAKSSGIPTSKIYEVLTKMTDKRVVLEVEENEKKKYVPIKPEDLISTLRSRMDMSLDTLKAALSEFHTVENISYIWNLGDYSSLMERARIAIEGAKSSILLSAWKDEVAELADALVAKEKKKLKIAIVHFGNPEVKIGQIFWHPIEDTLYAEKGGRGFTLVVDSKEVIIGTMYADGSVDGAWSRNRGFVTIAEDYVKHDIYIMKIVERFDTTLISRFGENYKLMRDIFSNKEVRG